MKTQASPTASKYPYSHATVVVVHAPVQDVFDFVDDHSRLSSHMTRRSWMMGGGVMSIETDAGQGRVVGSKLKLHGTVFGIRLAVEEIVTERTPPFRKFWETIGEPALLVIGSYRMGVELEEHGAQSRLRVSIDYALPRSRAPRWLARILANRYAGWCTRRMATDAAQQCGSAGTGG